MTLDVEQVPVSTVLDSISEQVGTPIQYPEGMSKTLITVKAAEEPADDVIRRIAARAGLAVVDDGKTVELRDRKGMVERVAVFRSGYADSKEIAEVARAMGGEGTQVFPAADRIFAAGSNAAVQRLEDLRPFFDSIPDAWQLELRLFRCNKILAESIGIGMDISGGLDLSAGLVAGSGVSPSASWGVNAAAAVKALFSASQSDTGAELVYSAPLYVLEGSSASLSSGESVPVLRKTVSPEGTVSTTGYDMIQTGFTFNVSARRITDGILLTLKPTLSAVTGFVEGVPITTKTEVSSTAAVRSGDWLILGGLETNESSDDRSGLPFLRNTKQSVRTGKTTLFFAIRAVRVYSALPRPDDQGPSSPTLVKEKGRGGADQGGLEPAGPHRLVPSTRSATAILDER